MPELRNTRAETSHTIVLARRGSPVTSAHHAVEARRSIAPPTERHSTAPRSFEQHHTDLAVQLGVYSFFGRVAVRTLMWLMVFQPVYVALGMELEEQPADASVEVVTEEPDTDNVSDEEFSDEDPTGAGVLSDNEPSVVEEAVETNTANEEPVSPEDTDLEETPSDVVEGDGTDGEAIDTLPEDASEGGVEEEDTTPTDTDTSTESDTETDGDASDSEDATGAGGDAGTSDDTTEATDTENNSGQETASTTATSTDETASSSDEVLPDEGAEGVTGIPQNPENAFIFSDGDCTLVAEGEFYCVRTDTPRIASGDPRVYAEKDREGDREIYYFDGVEVHRITNNSYDDFAPVFDEETLRIVWQAMLNDRLQVMLHEIPTNTTRQITSSRQNSSNPDIEGDVVVWQEWVGTNWEIMMTDVDTSGGEFEIEQLTDNGVHDMFPQAYEDLITWQSERGTSWEVIVYDMRTEKTTALEKNEGTKYENPRFVLLFDSKHENGDIETIGYDLNTGEMMELGTRANPQPPTPASPKDEAPDALPREATTTLKVKESGGDDDGNDDVLL